MNSLAITPMGGSAVRDYGKTPTTFWLNDALSFEAKSILSYLHSGPHTNWIGCFRCAAGYISDDLNLSVSKVRRSLAELENAGRIKCSGKYIFLPDFLLFNFVENGNKATSRFNEFASLPDGEFKEWVAQRMLEHMNHLSDAQRETLGRYLQPAPQKMLNNSQAVDYSVNKTVDLTVSQTDSETDTQPETGTETGTETAFQTKNGLKGGVGENVSASGSLPTTAPNPSASPPDAAPHGGSLPSSAVAKAEEPVATDPATTSHPSASPSVDAGKAGRQEENTPEHGRNDNPRPLESPPVRLSEPVSATEALPNTSGAPAVETLFASAPAAFLNESEKTTPLPGGEPAKAKKRKKRECCTLNTALDEFYRDNPDGRFIAEDDPILRWAGSIGLPEEFLVLAWREFERRFLDSRKLQKDWRAHFRNACRQNWFKLWYATPDGEFKLSTVGIQLDRELDAQTGHEMPIIVPPSPQIAFEVPTPSPPALDTAAGEMVAQLFSTTSTSFSAEKWSSP